MLTNESFKTKILIFSLVYLPKFVGGAEIAVQEITDRIDSVSFDMITLRTEFKPIEKIGHVTVYRIGPYVGGFGFFQKLLRSVMKYIYPLWAYMYACKLHKRNNYSGVWSIMANYAGFAALFFKLRYSTVRFILTLQEGDPISYIKRRVWFVYPLFKHIFIKADIVQAISHHLGVFAVNMGFRAEPHIVPNGVDIQRFSYEFSKKTLQNLKTKIGLLPKDIVLITTSRLVKKNGLQDIIDALALLPQQYKLLVLGVGELEHELRFQAKRLGVDARVVFVGFVSHSDLPKYLRISNIFIRPSLSEGLGNSFLEAMAVGLPVIATPVGGIPDFLINTVTGLFCGVRDPQSIYNQVLRLGNTQLYSALAENGKRLVREKYGWEGISANIHKLFI